MRSGSLTASAPGQNRKLRKLVADLSLDKEALQSVIRKKRLELVALKAAIEQVQQDYAFSDCLAARFGPQWSPQSFWVTPEGLDTDARVIYIGTFSKVMFPALRLGYVVVPKDLVEAFSTARDATDQFSSTLYQAALADFIREGYFARHIRRMRMLYIQRRTWSSTFPFFPQEQRPV